MTMALAVAMVACSGAVGKPGEPGEAGDPGQPAPAETPESGTVHKGSVTPDAGYGSRLEGKLKQLTLLPTSTTRMAGRSRLKRPMSRKVKLLSKSP